MYIPITKPYISGREYELIKESLDSGWLVQGPKVRQFEEKIAHFTGARYSVAVSSCTSGQFIMSRILDIKPGDEVILPAFTWISTANAVEFLGAKPVFCDISLDTFNINTFLIKDHITTSTRAIYPVSLFGLVPDMPEISHIAVNHNIRIVEDCACSLGSRLGGMHCGLFGDAGILSFHPRKSITTGEGGMIITNWENVDRMARSLRDHGADMSDHTRHIGKKSFQMSAYQWLGYNMRMTDLQGAMGVAQMEKLEEIVDIRLQLAREFNDRLSHINWLKLPAFPGGYQHTYQTYCTLFKPQETYNALEKKDANQLDKLHEERNTLMGKLEEKGIMTRPGTHSVPMQKLYQDIYGYHKMDFPNAYAADRLTIALPFYPGMTEEEKDYLFEQLNKVAP
ncbi:MAG: DegT/DnrJ/EryC1/StrS family aminotransferase [Bacteroidales bacterium]|nr:DegT/DnrJ/EryC1/StrS family aminotransferase [Bacteroidales bacterium]